MPASMPRIPVVSAIALAIGAGGLGVALLPQRAANVCPTGAEPLQRVELVFGLSRSDAPDISDAEWQAFLEAEVTPRFPDGLTVLAGQGQWRTASGTIVREPSRLLLVWVRAGDDLEDRVEAIRSAWKTAHQQESVLRADSADCVAF